MNLNTSSTDSLPVSVLLPRDHDTSSTASDSLPVSVLSYREAEERKAKGSAPKLKSDDEGRQPLVAHHPSRVPCHWQSLSTPAGELVGGTVVPGRKHMINVSEST
eukprot:1489830-Rhodomonas_salina.2